MNKITYAYEGSNLLAVSALVFQEPPGFRLKDFTDFKLLCTMNQNSPKECVKENVFLSKKKNLIFRALRTRNRALVQQSIPLRSSGTVQLVQLSLHRNVPQNVLLMMDSRGWYSTAPPALMPTPHPPNQPRSELYIAHSPLESVGQAVLACNPGGCSAGGDVRSGP